MIIPIRCFTCGKVVGHMWQKWLKMIQEDTPEGY
jgi:DNA-directed RNA polymerases I, II, and III subunit RPABC5